MEGIDPFLNACSAGVVYPDDRATCPHRVVHNLADLLSRYFGQGSAQHREVLRIRKNLPLVHKTAAGDHRVTREPLTVQPQVGCTMSCKGVDLCERPLIEEFVQPLAGSHLPALALSLDSPLSAP